MDELRELLQESLNNEFISAVLSNPRDRAAASKVRVRPVLVKDRLLFQTETLRGSQAFHENLTAEEAVPRLLKYMENMKQLQLETTGASASALVSKKGKVTVRRRLRETPGERASLSHNREKRYILKEGVPVPFLRDLGVMTEDGRIVRARYDKFRQINRFLEFIEDILPELAVTGREIRILDFGCGKSYFTFAVYYYLHELKGLDVRIVGLDLKSDVIRRCSELGRKYGYEKLTFLKGDIADYEGFAGGEPERAGSAVDLVITLHACDTATDYALAKAIGWKAKVILSVPCCQHELNGQIGSETLEPVFRHGIIKERVAALVTDALRAAYLEQEGYAVDLLEFIDMEHTPKNILIRAVRTGKRRDDEEAVRACEEFLHVSPTIKELIRRDK